MQRSERDGQLPITTEVLLAITINYCFRKDFLLVILPLAYKANQYKNGGFQIGIFKVYHLIVFYFTQICRYLSLCMFLCVCCNVIGQKKFFLLR